jgi:hypothetical protein
MPEKKEESKLTDIICRVLVDREPKLARKWDKEIPEISG